MSAHPHTKTASPGLTLSDVLLQAKDHLADGNFTSNTRATLAKIALCRSVPGQSRPEALEPAAA